MNKFKEIRPIVVGIVKKDNKILGMPGLKKETNQKYVRLIGGGVEFLEPLEVALKREFKEELNVDIKVNEYLGFEDSIIVYDGKDAHEHVFLYEIDVLADLKNEYNYEEITDEGEKLHQNVCWFDIEDIKSGKILIFPTIAKNFI